MKISKYIDTLLKRRTKCAKQLMDVCWQLDKWLQKNEVEPDDDCWMGGVETYTNPDGSEREVRRAIEEK